MRRVITAALGAALIAIGAVAFAGHHGGGHAGHHGDHEGHRGDRMAAHLDKMADELGLTDGQRAEIQQIAARNADGELRKAMKANRKALKEASEFDNYDPGVVAELAVEQGELVAQSIIKRHEARQQMLAVLTDAQRAELKTLHSERRSRMKERRKERLMERAERLEREEG